MMQTLIQTAAPRLTFDAKDRAFHDELHRRVDAYFDERGLSRKANGRVWAKVALYTASFTSLYALLVFGHLPPLVALALCFALGFLYAGLGFNIGHDAIHGALSDKSWVNRLWSMSFDVVGASSYNWSNAHNFVHHTYTNVPGVDHDLEPGPWLLFKPTPKPTAIYRLQHLYCWFLYGFTTVVWVLKKDFAQIFAPDPRTGKASTLVEKLKVFRSKAFYLVFFVVLPLVFVDGPWWHVLVGSLAMHFAAGFSLAMIFQLAHVVEGPSFPTPNGSKLPTGFAAHQLMTTSNFGGSNQVLTFLFGGLDHQVEHHLFPKICHVHYPALAPIVRDCARQFGVPYHEHRSFLGALASHARLMHRLGRPERAVVVVRHAEPLLPAASRECEVL
jgi:linoleoyl-CoA desaturase